MIYQIAYRHIDGSVQGFIGHGETEEAAETDGLRQIQQCCARLKSNFDDRRVIRDHSAVMPSEQKALLQQWRQLGGSS